MSKRIIFLFFIFSPLLLFAQSMSDEQVIKFVTEEKAKGSDQSAIVSKLLSKGVTPAQMRRIKDKYEKEQSQLGAVNITDKGFGTTTSRLRTDRQAKDEKKQSANNYMLQSQIRGKNGLGNMTVEEQRELMGDEISFMDIDSLVYYKNLLKDESEVFGRNIFNNEFLSFEPNMNKPTPADYKLGAGDNVIIDVWGASQETFDEIISPDGTVTLTGIGPVRLSGMTVSESVTYLKKVIGKYYESSQVTLSLGQTRSVQVQVLGEVATPGTYTLSSLSTAFNALYAAGGISDIGTLRNIKVFRGGKQISTIDVYDFIINGNVNGNVRLQDDDVIIVDSYDCLVNLRGKVKRPMFYEMKSGESLASIIKYSGGFTGDAYTKNVRLIRKSGHEYSIHTVYDTDMSAFSLLDGDSIYVDSIIPRFSNMVEIRGAVFHPGMFQMGGKINTVKDLISAAEGIREDAFIARAVMHRQKEDLTLQVISVDVKGLLEGIVPDMPLKKNDVLFIPSKLDMIGEQTVKIGGEVQYPGVYMYADNTSLEDIVLQAGGLTDAASTVKVDVYRRITDSKSLKKSELMTETHTFALKNGFVVDGQQGFLLKPYDEVVVRKSPSYTEQQNVTIEGAVNFVGDYAMTTKNFKLSDLVNAAGGLSSMAYAKGARLERRMTEEERIQRETTLRTSQIALYEESMKADKGFDLNRADTLLTMKLDLGNTYPVAVNLDKALKEPGGVDDVTLREGDKLVVPQYSNTVKISGEVMYPISMNYKDGESLKYYIKRAGGYGDNARKNRVYAIYMNGAVELISHHSSKDIQPGCEIVVPSKKQKRQVTTAEMMSMGTSAASIATMIITVANILK